MKVFVPSHIKGGFLNTNITLGMFSLGLWQLMIVMVGLGASMGIFMQADKIGMGKTVAAIPAVINMIITIGIAFFNISELTLLPFIAKKIQTVFIDTPQKYFTNYTQGASQSDKIINPINIAIASLKTAKVTKHIIEKERTVDADQLAKLQTYV